MDRGGGDALALELRDEPVGAALGAHEHHRARHAFGDRGEHLDAVELVHPQEPVRHVVDVSVSASTSWRHRVVHVAAHQHVDLAVERRGEQERLAVVRDLAHDPLDLRQESHVGHAVGLVDHEDADLVEVELAPLEQVDHAGPGSRPRSRCASSRLRTCLSSEVPP